VIRLALVLAIFVGLAISEVARDEIRSSRTPIARVSPDAAP
jgi:hypothetical protein